MLEIFKLLFIIIIIFFFFFLTLFLYKGSLIYELITLTNYNDIYEKVNSDAAMFVNKNNKLNIALSSNNIYSSSGQVEFNSVINSLLITGNNINPILDLDKDKSKIITIFASIKKTEEKYPVLNINEL